MRLSLILPLLVIACTSIGQIGIMDPASRSSGTEKKAWEAFFAGVKCLQDEGDRKRAAGIFEQVANGYPESRYAKDSQEIAGFLRQMVEEDNQWQEPLDPNNLSIDEKIAYYIYHLRDVNCHQASQPGMCSVFEDFGRKPPGTNAAMMLQELGEPAIPALIRLLEDRRPTRSVGYWRDFNPSRTILRFQDAAIEIIDESLPVPFYQRSSTGAYFSNEKPEVRESVIRSLKSYFKSSLGKTEVEKEWLVVEAAPGIYQIMTLLKDLALVHGEKERVLATLHQLCSQRNPLQVPQISALMCELGDYGKVGEVASAYVAGNYDVDTTLPDDPVPGNNAANYALHQVILYGTDSQRNAIQKNAQQDYDLLGKERALFVMLLDTANENWTKLPKTYDRSRYPVYMLVASLTNRLEWGTTSRGSHDWTIRRCDAAAKAIQKFTGKQFQFYEEKSEAEKDEAIKRILIWWKEQPTRLQDQDKAEKGVLHSP